MFKAILLEKNADGTTHAVLTRIDDGQLPPEGDVTVAVEYSTVNYKDALAITGKSPVVRKWPMVPGIDGAGRIVASSHSDWKAGDAFLLNGWGVGEGHWGCLAQRAKLKGEWLIPLPVNMSAKNAMAIGTAGYTAMLCVMALEDQGIRKESGDILVTGATGGVGSVAISLLSGAGYRVVASTGKVAEEAYLKSLGAADIIDRAELSATNGKPLQKERWAGVIDSVGSHTLVNALAQTCYGGTVAACGLAQGMDLSGTVAPFILRGVRLIGVDSVMAPRKKRVAAWNRLAMELSVDKLAKVAHELTLNEVISNVPNVIAGKIRGRLVVDVNA